MKRREIKIRNQPGIYKIQFFNPATKGWTESGKYRACRRIQSPDGTKKEQRIFNNYEDAVRFRNGGTPLNDIEAQRFRFNSQTFKKWPHVSGHFARNRGGFLKVPI